MAQRTPKSSRSQPPLPPQRAAVNLHAAGIDIGAEAHWVAVPPRDAPQPVRRVGAYTADLEALADWLATCGMTTIALASTGVSGIPRFALLATRGCAVLWVDPQPVQKSTGRPKRARHDCQWIPRRHTCGLLAGAFRPADQIGVRRRDLRQRALLRTSAAQPIQQRHNALTQRHLTLQHVVSASTGVTGLAILRAILAGARAPTTRAQRRDSRGTHDAATIARAVQGHGRDEPLCALAHAVALYEGSHQKITACAQPLDASLQTCADRSDGQPLPPPARPRKRGGNHPACAVREPLHRISGVDLTQSEGLDDTTSLVILSAIGLDRTRWPTVKHVTSWLGLCPPHRVSGGKVVSRRTTPCANRAATALRLAAACFYHSQSALGAFFRRMQARMGAPKAMTAMAHTLARRISTMRKDGTAYVRQGMEAYAQQSRDRMVKNMTRRAKALGYTLVKAPEGYPA